MRACAKLCEEFVLQHRDGQPQRRSTAGLLSEGSWQRFASCAARFPTKGFWDTLSARHATTAVLSMLQQLHHACAAACIMCVFSSAGRASCRLGAWHQPAVHSAPYSAVNAQCSISHEATLQAPPAALPRRQEAARLCLPAVPSRAQGAQQNRRGMQSPPQSLC